MGTGKTEAAITYMNEHKEKKFIYITPYLAESNRIKEGCPELHFVEPSNKLSEYHFRKTEHTAALISEGRNITTTHAAFRNYNRDTLAMIRELGYTLIIDESLDILIESQMKTNDVGGLVATGFLESDGTTYRATDKLYDSGKFEDEMKMFRSRDVLCVDGQKGQKLYYWALPQELLTSFDEVFVLTYLFTGQALCYFMKIYKIPYTYTSRVINVTFKYSVAEFNKAGRNRYIRFGYKDSDLNFNDCVAIKDGELVGIILGQPVEYPVSDEVLGKYFGFEGGVYTLIKTPKTLKSTAELRRTLYNDGFVCNGVRYVRWKRSSGSSRVGKCLFIDEKLYARMHKWEMCGLKVAEGEEVDLAALESYISLPSSSIIDILEINPENILVIDDYESKFFDRVMSVSEDGDHLIAEEKDEQITNSIWDGQGLIDISAMGKYSDKGMILLRNLFFKCCCFNTNLQQWFADHGITEVSQLKGYTKAKRVEDIKIITTPSSIKYLKFGTINDWMKHIDNTFGVVKYDKPTHFFDGRMVQTHYQLLNSLQMNKAETAAFLKETFDYMTAIRTDPAVLRYHIKYPIEDEFDISPAESKNDVVYKLLGLNDRFAQTKLYHDFKIDILKSFTKNLRLGHVLVEGNYETLFGNPIEMLQASIGKFDGVSVLGVGNIHTKRFGYGQRLVGSRSPHISMSNVWVPTNVECSEIDRYFNLTNEIVCINSIGENVLNELSGCDR